MKQRILVTGNRGFIGSHVQRKLEELGHDVTGLDTLMPDVHGGQTRWPANEAENVGDYTPPYIFDAIIHLAAKVGVGQSMYAIGEYVANNTLMTADFLEALQNHPPKRLIVASSMSVYGEGPRDGTAYNVTGKYVEWPLPCPETRPPDLRSIYALTKYDQEQLCLIWGRAYDVPTVALRFFNTYGPGQALSNPYTGVLAIFASRLLNDKPPVIYEDGLQSRDFIHVDDVANAVVHAATTDMPSGAYNVGTGVATSIHDVARAMIRALHNVPADCTLPLPIKPCLLGTKRAGDIRHCFADISKIKATGWEPKIPFAEGIMEYCAWLSTQPKPEDKFDQAHAELVEKGLMK